MKLKQKEVPIEYKARVGGTKLNALKVGFEELWTILRLVFWKPGKGRTANDSRSEDIAATGAKNLKP